MENDDVPDWAIERALELVGNPYNDSPDTVRVDKGRHDNAVLSFARYIAQHEKPPVDPDLMLAREIAGLIADEVGVKKHGINYRMGEYDDEAEMVTLLKLLKERK